MKLLKRVLRDEKGATMIMVAISLVMIFGFAVLTIDLSLVQLAKTQLQNAADAGALAGALGLAISDGDQAVATAEAIKFAGLNVAVQDIQQPVIITDADVTFPGPYKVRVRTNRTLGTGDPVTLYFLKVLGPLVGNEGDVTAKATAMVFPLYGVNCLRPFCPPDRWDDVDNDSTWDPAEGYTDTSGNGVYDQGEPFVDANGNGVWDPAELYDPYHTGYRAPDDVGDQVILKLRNSNKSPRMGWYYAINFGPINTGDPVLTGADWYREWITECEPYMVHIGDQLQIEPGNMVGPTAQGLEDLINKDLTAEWDPVGDSIKNSAYIGTSSPRIIMAPAFDPTLGTQSDVHGRDYVTVTKIMVLFVEQHLGDEVVGRFMRKATEGDICPDCPIGFLYTAALIE